jgi:hypothetical protein
MVRRVRESAEYTGDGRHLAVALLVRLHKGRSFTHRHFFHLNVLITGLRVKAGGEGGSEVAGPVALASV